MKRRGMLRLALVGLLPLAGCGDVVDEIIGACLDADGPSFNTPGLPDGGVGQPYAAEVEAGITREPYDDRFIYRFRLIGSLPPGLRWSQSGNTRYVQLSGTPTVAGSYSFRLEVTVEDPLESPQGLYTLCWYVTDKTYRIAVAGAAGRVSSSRTRTLVRRVFRLMRQP